MIPSTPWIPSKPHTPWIPSKPPTLNPAAVKTSQQTELTKDVPPIQIPLSNIPEDTAPTTLPAPDLVKETKERDVPENSILPSAKPSSSHSTSALPPKKKSMYAQALKNNAAVVFFPFIFAFKALIEPFKRQKASSTTESKEKAKEIRANIEVLKEQHKVSKKESNETLKKTYIRGLISDIRAEKMKAIDAFDDPENVTIEEVETRLKATEANLKSKIIGAQKLLKHAENADNPDQERSLQARNENITKLEEKLVELKDDIKKLEDSRKLSNEISTAKRNLKDVTPPSAGDYAKGAGKLLLGLYMGIMWAPFIPLVGVAALLKSIPDASKLAEEKKAIDKLDVGMKTSAGAKAEATVKTATSIQKIQEEEDEKHIKRILDKARGEDGEISEARLKEVILDEQAVVSGGFPVGQFLIGRIKERLERAVMKTPPQQSIPEQKVSEGEPESPQKN